MDGLMSELQASKLQGNPAFGVVVKLARATMAIYVAWTGGPVHEIGLC